MIRISWARCWVASGQTADSISIHPHLAPVLAWLPTPTHLHSSARWPLIYLPKCVDIKSHFGGLFLTISPVCEYRILRAAGHHEVVAYIESCICVLLHHHHHRCCGGWGLLTQRHEDLTLTSASCQFAATTATATAAATTHSSVVVTFSCSLLLSNIHGV